MNLAEALGQEVGQLCCEIEDLKQLLHESHERESMVEGKPRQLGMKPVT